MALDKPYLDIPGTTIFDAEQSRKGYGLNQFCMSLMKAENRARFKANERAYLDEWPMTDAQKAAAEEAKVKAAAAAEVAKQQQTAAEDRVAARYFQDMKAKGKQVPPPQTAAPPPAPAPAKK